MYSTSNKNVNEDLKINRKPTNKICHKEFIYSTSSRSQ